ncbi:class I SAM-dependent methyltransferase [unidentified bacterial endosymbiont]|uniref:class I SAM-dependent methyltransferase n=1 Tax=unidentified bacterial endosymbiont TaxID=2355 RepID=UPI00209E11D8|nr:class I SAM-dependent methyltransferase [unidentified bacterial endosymbiont]
MSKFVREERQAVFLETHYSFNQQHQFWINANAPPFGYSDGEAIEQQLLEIVQQANDVSITSSELRQRAQESWPLMYHLHARRANLLRPVQQHLTGKVLEIGAGCGAITRFLGEVGGEILAIEGSERRAAVAAARCRDLPNVTVVVDQFHQVPIIPEYDVVTLIGVLEYARLYFPARTGIDPVDALLARARQFLKPQGVLILAIENQLGLKYFSGYAEDHTSQLMQGIEDRYSMDGVVTFGRVELAQRLQASGFAEQRWWFPFPDYKLPTLLLSENLLTQDRAIDIAPLLSSALAADAQHSELSLFSLELASQAISRNKLFGELSNSFLVIAGAQKTECPQDILGYHYATDRRAEFSKVVTFSTRNSEVCVSSERLYPPVAITQDIPLMLTLSEDEPFVKGEHWQQKLYQIVNQPGWTLEELTAWAKIWLAAFLRQARLNTLPTSESLVPGNLLDALPRNLILKQDGTAVFIDQEWQLQYAIEFGYIVFRALFFSFLTVRAIAIPQDGVPIVILELFFELTARLNLLITLPDITRYLVIEDELQSWVCDTKQMISLPMVQARLLPIRVLAINEFKKHNKIAELLESNSATINQYQEQLALLEKYIVQIHNSYSWRVMRPVRFLSKVINFILNKINQ